MQPWCRQMVEATIEAVREYSTKKTARQTE